MDLRSNLDSMKSLLGVETTAAPTSRPARTQTVCDSVLGADRATLSSAASEISQATDQDAVRQEKVEAIRTALASGTYNVPASAVATKLVDAMLVGHK